MGIIFEWDARKARANLTKHNISFQEATTVFSDPFSITIEAHTVEREIRFVILGLSTKGRLLVVIHTERRDRIRIISARKDTKNERNQYEQE